MSPTLISSYNDGWTNPHTKIMSNISRTIATMDGQKHSHFMHATKFHSTLNFFKCNPIYGYIKRDYNNEFKLDGKLNITPKTTCTLNVLNHTADGITHQSYHGGWTNTSLPQSRAVKFNS